MTFMEAKAKLKELAGGRYHTLRFSLSEYKDGTMFTECSVYVDGHSYHTAPAWEEALSKLDAAMHPERVTEEYAMSMAPDGPPCDACVEPLTDLRAEDVSALSPCPDCGSTSWRWYNEKADVAVCGDCGQFLACAEDVGEVVL